MAPMGSHLPSKADSARRVAIMQPTFLPWIGYFALIHEVDTFVFLDSVQFAKRSWQQRNQIKTASGAQWITMPVASSGLREQFIKDTLISAEGDSAKKLINSLSTNYGKAPHFNKYSDSLFAEFHAEKSNLCVLNLSLIRLFMKLLSIEGKTLFRSSELPVSGAKANLLVSICQHLRFTRYVSAPGSKEYIEESGAFGAAGIEVEYFAYEHPVYQQLYGNFLPYMSIVDLVFNEGERSLAILQ